MKKFSFLIKCIILVLIVFAIVTYNKTLKHPIKTGAENNIIVANQNTLSSVLKENHNKFVSSTCIKIYSKIKKVSITIKLGTYEFPEDITLEDMISSLKTGKYNTSIKTVTIPEGYTIEQIGEALEKKEIISSDDFIQACKEYPLPDYVSDNSKKRYALEGFLFPDTYEFQKGVNGDTVVKTMLSRFEQIIKSIENEQGIEIKTTDLEEYIIKASIIEREVVTKSEKPIVSSVIENRLKINMPLQIDATVLYAMGTHKDKTTINDTKTASPYNTYYIHGLPVGAISNPGKDSIESALMPEDTDYIFYMSKDGKTHKFFTNGTDFTNYKNSK